MAGWADRSFLTRAREDMFSAEAEQEIDALSFMDQAERQIQGLASLALPKLSTPTISRAAPRQSFAPMPNGSPTDLPAPMEMQTPRPEMPDPTPLRRQSVEAQGVIDQVDAEERDAEDRRLGIGRYAPREPAVTSGVRPDQPSAASPVMATRGTPAAMPTGQDGLPEFRSYLRTAAAKRGLDPDEVEAVMGKEGPGGWNAVGTFDTGESYGPLQLHVAGGSNPKAGMGDRFIAATGKHPKDDPLGAVEFALDELSRAGTWGEWYGADVAFAGQGGRNKAVTRIQPVQGPQPTTPAPAEEAAHNHADDYEVAFGFNQQYTNPFNAAIPSHRGVDLVVRGAKDGGRGLPVKAFRGGTVYAVTNDPNGGNGLIVATGDPDAPYDYYGHFDAIGVKNGQQIGAGEDIGVLGASGTEGFPHVHYEVRRNVNGDPMDQLIDPTPYMRGTNPRVSLNAGSPRPAAPPPAEPAAGVGQSPGTGSGSPAPSEQLWSPDAPADTQAAYQMGTGRNAGGVMLRAPNVPTPGDTFETGEQPWPPSESPTSTPAVSGPASGTPSPATDPFMSSTGSTSAPMSQDTGTGAATPAPFADPTISMPEYTQPPIPAPTWTYGEASMGPEVLGPAAPDDFPIPPPSPYAPGQAESMEPAPNRFEATSPTVTSGVVSTIGQAAQNAGTAAVEASQAPTNALEVAQGAVPTLKGLNIVQSALDQFGSTVGRQVAVSLGWTDDEIVNFFGMPISAQDMGGFAGSVLLDPTNLIPGGQAGSLTRVGARAAQEGMEAAGGAVRSGARALGEAAQDVGTRVRGAWDANAERVAALDARMAQQGSTTAPGTFGVVTGADDYLPRPRVVPPEVADTLDFPVRVPTDPAAIRAIEAAGGTVDERGVTLGVTRAQAPTAAGGVATRGGVFYEAIPEGGRSSFVTGADNPNAVGGTQALPRTMTRFRSPLILDDAPGSSGGFDNAMRQMGAGPKQADLDAAWDDFTRLDNEIAALDGGARPDVRPREYNQILDAREAAKQRLRDLEDQTPTSAGIDEAIRQARSAGPEGSPERAQALKDVVSRYGGDPNLIDDLLAIRGADASESAWAIKENILSHHARRQGYDGVVTVQPHGPNEAAVSAHPKVVSAAAAVDEASTAAERAADEHQRIYESLIPEQFRRLPNESFNDYYARITQGDRTAHERAIYNAQNHPSVLEAQQRAEQASEAIGKAEQAYVRAQNEARAELGTHRITELTDVREGRNPTPGTENPIYPRVKAQLEEQLARAQADWDRIQETAYAPGHTMTPAEHEELLDAMRRVGEAEGGLRVLRDSNQYEGPPGYTLREDIRRRERPFAELERTYKDLQQRARTSATAAEGEDLMRQMKALEPELMEALRRERSTTAQATPGMATRAGSDILARVNADIGSSIGSGTFGAAAGLAAPAETPEERRRNALTGAAIGMVGGPLASRALRSRGGALATPGISPGAGGYQPPPGLLQRFPGVQGAMQASQRRQQQMAARGIQPLSPLQWTGEAIKNVGYSSMIGPATATVNVLGNLLEPIWAVPKEATRAAVRGAPREFVETTMGAFYGLGQTGRAMVDALAARGRYASHPDQPRLSERTVNPVGHAFASATEAGGRLFSGLPDAFFGTIARHAGDARSAAQQATDEGLQGAQWKARVQGLLQDAQTLRNGGTPADRAAATKITGAGDAYADRQTFRDDLGTWGRGASKWAGREVPVIGNFLTPFFTTPWNMNMTLLERTPVGAAMNRQKGFDKAYDATVGTALIAGLVMGPAAAGQITGSGPDDKEKRDMLQAEGWRPYHTLIGDTYVPNRTFGIYGRLLNAVGDAHDFMAYQKKDASARAMLTDAGKRVGRLVKEEPYLQGLADILAAFDSAGSGAEGLAASNLARLVPYAATARTVGTAMDPTERQPDRGSDVPMTESIRQRVQSSLGMRSDLPVAQDVLGRPKENPQQGIGAVLPKVSRKNAVPLIQAFRDGGVDIGAPPDDISGVKLTPAQQRRYREVMGRELERLAAPAVTASTWKDMPPTVKKTLLETYQGTAKSLAEIAVQQEAGPQFWQQYTTGITQKAAP